MGTAPSKNTDGVAFQNTAIPIQVHPLSTRTNIQFSNPLVERLEDPKGTNTSLDELIQRRVAEELARLKKVEETLTDDAISSASTTDSNDLDSVLLRSQLETLKRHVTPSSRAADEKVDEAQGKVVTCLRTKRPLDCRSEIDSFKSVIRDLQQEFIKQYQ